MGDKDYRWEKVEERDFKLQFDDATLEHPARHRDHFNDTISSPEIVLKYQLDNGTIIVYTATPSLEVDGLESSLFLLKEDEDGYKTVCGIYNGILGSENKGKMLTFISGLVSYGRTDSNELAEIFLGLIRSRFPDENDLGDLVRNVREKSIGELAQLEADKYEGHDKKFILDHPYEKGLDFFSKLVKYSQRVQGDKPDLDKYFCEELEERLRSCHVVNEVERGSVFTLSLDEHSSPISGTTGGDIMTQKHLTPLSEDTIRRVMEQVQGLASDYSGCLHLVKED
jgi:hypothetical protein